MGLRLDFAYEICVIQYRQLIVKVNAVARRFVGNPFKSPHEVQMPERSSKLAVCDVVKSQFFLPGDNFCDFIVGDLVEFLLADLACLIRFLGVLQGLRS